MVGCIMDNLHRYCAQYTYQSMAALFIRILLLHSILRQPSAAASMTLP